MDYTTRALGFRIKKILRYVELYGVRRTFVKVRGQYHMKKNYKCLPHTTSKRPHNGSIGLIGCGNYAFANIAYYLDKNCRGAMRACMDPNASRAASLCESFGLQYFTSDADELINDPNIRLVFIASNHASHAEYAIRCINAGKHVHIEKPHVVSRDQLHRLMEAIYANPHCNIYLGFNRPRTKLFRKLQVYLESQAGPLMINWFIAGHEIDDDHWYFNENEGGRILGNLCHWTDLTLHLVGIQNAFPCSIIPSTPRNAKSDFVVSIIFADRTCASITFSAKGHAFEGVREVLNLHKGDVLATLTDFQKLYIDIVDQRRRFSSFYRDHGHEANILNSYHKSISGGCSGEASDYVRTTALFFLAIKEAIDLGQSVDFGL
jgi:predicted dehydrogenase